MTTHIDVAADAFWIDALDTNSQTALKVPTYDHLHQVRTVTKCRDNLSCLPLSPAYQHLSVLEIYDYRLLSVQLSKALDYS